MAVRVRSCFLLLVILLAAKPWRAEEKRVVLAPPAVQARLAAAKSIFVGLESEDQSYVLVGKPQHLGYAMLLQAVQHWGYKLADSPAHSDLSILIAGHAKGDFQLGPIKASLSLMVLDSQTGNTLWEDEVPLGRLHWVNTNKLAARDFFKAMTALLAPLHANPLSGVQNVLEPMPAQLLHATKVWIETHESMPGASGEQHRDYTAVLRQALQGTMYTLASRRQDADIVLQLWWNESFDLTTEGRVAGQPEFVLTVRDPKSNIVLWTFRRQVNPRSYPYTDVPSDELKDAKALLSDVRMAIAVGK